MNDMFCIICDTPCNDADPLAIDINYDLFCDPDKADIKIVVCPKCYGEDSKPESHDAMEMIAASKIFRIHHTDVVATPRDRKDK